MKRSRVASALGRLLREPPLRLATRFAVRALPFGVEIKSEWDVVSKPQYLVGLVHAAKEAIAQGINRFCAIEFGVAGGSGLVELERYAVTVERELNIQIDVVGFDTGTGLPSFCGDHRDHPDLWRAGDYPMNVERLRNSLNERTELMLGKISDTLPHFVQRQCSPVGFASYDVDLYSSTVDALKIFSLPGKQLLNRVTLYFDDVYTAIYHRRAGEYLAIQEFNESQRSVFIDNWYNVKVNRPFPEAFWTNKMFIAHHLDAIDRVRISRPVEVWRL